MEALNTLFLTHEGTYLHVDHEAFVIEAPNEDKRYLPLINFNSVVAIGNVMVSPSALGRCAQDGRTIAFFDYGGRFLARVEGEVNGNVLLRQAQYRLIDNPVGSLDLARGFVAGKIRNCRTLIQRAARSEKESEIGAVLNSIVARLERLVSRLPSVTSTDELRGVEGEAAALYFQALPRMLNHPEEWKFSGRNRRPPRDPVNALLSFLYAVLAHDIRSALEGVGLDPQAGILHTLRPGRPALALDLMEEFRPLFVDRLVIALINLRQVKVDDFIERSGGAVEIKEDARRKVIMAYSERKREEIHHPATDRQVEMRLAPHLQARILARAIRGDLNGYIPFLIK